MLNNSSDYEQSLNESMLGQIRSHILELAPEPGPTREVAPGIFAVRREQADFSTHCFDWPMAALTVQGRKAIETGTSAFELSSGTMLVICIDMPSISTLLDASLERPYLGILIRLDRNILASQASALAAMPEGQCLNGWTEQADIAYLDIFRRAACLALEPGQADLLLPLLMQEMHLRLLSEPRGGLLRSLYWHNGRDSRISDVVNWLRENISASVTMEELAKMANMSVSSFHRHFKEITGSSPLQYHKKLRLYEAQRIMLAGSQSVAEAALSVGYESITQFNREYRRLFGEPPGRDIQQRRRRLGH